MPSDVTGFWNGPFAQRWREGRVDDPIAATLLARAAPAAGERVVDVGCGAGDTCRLLRDRVAPTGTVTGIDVSATLLANARERVKGVTFVEADAERHKLAAASVELVFSNFGMTFFEDPLAAFSNFRRALVPGGRVAFSCFGALARNPSIGAPFAIARELAPGWRPPRLDVEGPFAFEHSDRIEVILKAARFVEIRVEPFDGIEPLGLTVDAALDRVFVRPLVGEALAGLPADVQRTVRDQMRPLIEHGPRADGAYGLPLAAWIVTASRPRT